MSGSPFTRYYRVEQVEAAPTEDGNHMLIFPINSFQVDADGLMTFPTSFLLPKEEFDKHYLLEGDLPPFIDAVDSLGLRPSHSHSLAARIANMNDQVADFLKEPFVGSGFESAVPLTAASTQYDSTQSIDDAEAFNSARPIVDLIINRIPDTISNFSGFISLEMLLWGAEVAFNLAIGKLPFPVPETVKNNLWQMIETTIRNIWQEKNPA